MAMPTFTQVAAPTITGVLLLPGDAKLTVWGAPNTWTQAQNSVPADIPGMFRPPYMPQTTATIPAYSIVFNFTGTELYFKYYTRSTQQEVRVSVDREYPYSGSTRGWDSTGAAGVTTYLRMQWPIAATREVRIDTNAFFGGVFVADAALVAPITRSVPKIICVSDSLAGAKAQGRGQTVTGGVAGDPASADYTNATSYFYQAAQTVSWDNCWNWGIGSAAFYDLGDGGGNGNFQNRIPSVIAENPQLVWWDCHVFNDLDSNKTVAQEVTAFNTTMTALRAGLPTVPVIAFLTPDAPALAALGGAALIKPYNDALISAGASYNMWRVDPLDGRVIRPNGTVAGTLGKWVVGDGVTGGKYITSDGVHPTEYGAWELAQDYINAVNLIKTELALGGGGGGGGGAAPTGLALVPGDRQLRVTWNPVAGAISYNVYVGTDPARVQMLTTDMLTHIPNGQTQSVRVAAVLAAGETQLSAAVTATPTPPAGPTKVLSFGPNGTHYPDRTPWLFDTIPLVQEVDCTWAAIKTAINLLTDAQVNAGVRLNVRPGNLPNGTDIFELSDVGSLAWRKRVLITPRDGRDTVTFGADGVHIRKAYNVAFVGFDYRTTGGDWVGFQFVGSSYSAAAWGRCLRWRINGLVGQNTEGFDVVEIAIAEPTVGEVDPIAMGSGNNSGGNAGGNGWGRYIRVIGCYSAPQYLPWSIVEETITITGAPTGGTFTLTYGGQTTAAIAYNASAATVQTRLEALSSLGAGNAPTTGPTSGPWVVTVTNGPTGMFADVAKMTADLTGLTGGTPAATITTLKTVGYGHNDGLQLYGPGVYYGFSFEDCSSIGSNNSAYQIGGTPADTDAVTGGFDYHSWFDHCLGVQASIGVRRYPLPGTAETLDTGQAINGAGEDYKLFSYDSIFAGAIYGSSKWEEVQNTRSSNKPAAAPHVGAFTVDSTLVNITSDQLDVLSPIPDDAYTAQIWGEEYTPPNPAADGVAMVRSIPGGSFTSSATAVRARSVAGGTFVTVTGKVRLPGAPWN